MSPTTIILAVLLLALSMAIRCVDIFRFSAFGVDTFANLLYARRRKKEEISLYRVGKIVYPQLLPRLLYYLSNKVSVWKLHVIPKLFDLFTSIVVFLFTFWLSGNEFTALIALLIYTFSPINIVNGYGIGTRNIGSFFLVSAILESYIAGFDSLIGYTMFVLAVLSGLLMMLSSRIAYKSFFLLAIVAAFLWPVNVRFGIFLLAAGLSLALCLLLTRGKFVDDVKGHIFLVNFFRKRRGKEKFSIKRLALVFYYDLWWLVGGLAVIYDAELFLATWLIVIVALSFLWPWGEGERHIALAVAPGSVLAASYLTHRPLLIVPVLLFEILIIIRFSVRVLGGRVLVSVDRTLLNVFGAIKKMGGDSLFLCLPTVYSGAVAYFTEKKVLYGESSSREGVLFQAEVLDAIDSEDSLEELVEKYSVTHIFVDKTRFQFTADAKLWEPIIQEERFAVLRRVDGGMLP